LVVLPIVARVGGIDGWASIGIGQSLGAFGTFTTSFGWNVVGSARLALERDDWARRVIYTQSLWMRGSMFVATAAVLGSIAFAISAPQFRIVGALTAVATALSGLTVSWYGVGTSQPTVIMKYESSPVAASMVLAIPALLLTKNLVFYPTLLIAGTVVGLLLMQRSLYGKKPAPALRSLGLGGAFRRNLSPALIDITGGAYASAPVPTARVVDGISAAAGVASADRIYRFGLVAIVVLGNALQGWVLELPAGASRYRRHCASVIAHTLLGIFGFLVLALLGQLIATFLLGGDVVPTWIVFVWYGFAFFSISVSTPLMRNLLIPADRTRVVLVATLSSAIIGLAGMILLGIVWGPEGVAAALALSEFVVVCILAVPAAQLLRHERRGTHQGMR
jgi:O-antigen/teichoic acid export membrane protein